MMRMKESLLKMKMKKKILNQLMTCELFILNYISNAPISRFGGFWGFGV